MLVLQASTAGLICFARPAKSCQRSSKKQLLTKVVCFRCWLSFQSRPCRHPKLQQTSDGFHPRKQCKRPQFNGNSACFHSKQGSASSSTTECAHPQSRQCRLQYKQYKPPKQSSANSCKTVLAFMGGRGILLRRMLDIGYLGVQQPF